MADKVWFEIDGFKPFPNRETAAAAAKEAAKATDGVIEIYRCSRALVRTVQRSVTLTETDIPTA